MTRRKPPGQRCQKQISDRLLLQHGQDKLHFAKILTYKTMQAIREPEIAPSGEQDGFIALLKTSR